MNCKKYKNIDVQFACFMCEELKKSYNDKLRWELRGPKGLNVGSESVDITGYDVKTEEPHILIEIERRRYGPVSNVAKVWSWLIDLKEEDKKKLQMRPILIQAFSAHYSKKKDDKRRKHCNRIGTLMEKAKVASYILIDFDYDPQEKAKNCEGACQRQAKALAGLVLKSLIGRL